ncbi:MAG TPA: BrnA antitoxin family protein [Ramlibacter sp.]|nr:BrnA antitoxin family protein [Ramlibacter sp.]
MSTSKAFSAKEIAAAKAAARAVPEQPAKDWSKATATPGGGVAKTIAEIRRVRGPNKRPTKEQVAIRLDPGVVGAFRAAGPGWQTRMNNALKEWLAEHPLKVKPKRAT